MPQMPQFADAATDGLLLGASLMLFADLAARTVVMPAELPVGIVTALIGAPFFLWLILHAREGRIWNSA